MIGPNASLAQINRIFNQGKKNHFTLLGEKDKTKFLQRQTQPLEQEIQQDPTEGEKPESQPEMKETKKQDQPPD